MKELTITDKAKFILKHSEDFKYKKDFAKKLDISRPTLNSRLSEKKNWGKLECIMINQLFYQIQKSMNCLYQFEEDKYTLN